MPNNMMTEFNRVLLKVLKVGELGQQVHAIDRLNDEQKIDLLDELIEATVTYKPHHDQSD
jgi:hypothetical protein